ncbi:hemagglutinin [Stigmatella sp. ncwal1]|uniref:Hemagglutinin n=1 Tax=Stigmatella ashevillensis TaxID=2995309 RepID=A0ABT5DE95_9BACT|nr:hemagglutinin [Stigmatella ashevillena]MDC0711384.1 hemagglutinin [Stigmatella ashevillena]
MLALLVTQRVLAEPDTFGVGSGRSGALSVRDSDSVVINRYTLLNTGVVSGARELAVSDASGFTAGELVLLHPSLGLTTVPASGAQAPVELSSGPVGRFEFARVESVSGKVVTLTAPLFYAHPAPGTQVVSVPEYTSVQVAEKATLRAAPWDGKVGGLLVFLVTGTLTNAGSLTVTGMGFRGGRSLDHASLQGCEGLDVPVAQGGAYKGEGLVAERFDVASGRGNLANGGGGGNCHNAGGGGGGHGGVGGVGGRSLDGARSVGGLGGAPVLYAPFERLVFGGGGGEGESDDVYGTGGGAGGGVMLIRAGRVQGQGRFLANGSAAADTVLPGNDGAGGGGAGGAISLRVGGGLECQLVEASGGKGGSTTNATLGTGPGGGGAGGVVFLQGSPLACPQVVSAGAAGVSSADKDSRGAGPLQGEEGPSQGLSKTLASPFGSLAPPVLSRPANGARGVSSLPLFEGRAAPGSRIYLFLDGQPYAEFSLGESQDSFSYAAAEALALGVHEVKVSSTLLGIHSALSAPSSFEVGGEVTPEPPAVVMVVPLEGARVEPTPLLAGKSPPDVTVAIEVDAVEVARVSADADGRFRYVLIASQALSPGTHQVSARVLGTEEGEPLFSQVTTFEVMAPLETEAGCGCGTASGGGLGALALLLGARASRRRARGPGRPPPARLPRGPAPGESPAPPAPR